MEPLQYVYNNISIYYYRRDRSFRRMFYTEWQHKFLVKYINFFPEFVIFKNYGNHGICRQAGRDVKWRKWKFSCVSHLIEKKIQIWVIMFNCLYLRIWNLVYTQRIFMSAYFVGSLCTKHCFKVRNYKILPRTENLRLCMTVKFNKNELNIDMQFFK